MRCSSGLFRFLILSYATSGSVRKYTIWSILKFNCGQVIKKLNHSERIAYSASVMFPPLYRFSTKQYRALQKNTTLAWVGFVSLALMLYYKLCGSIKLGYQVKLCLNSDRSIMRIGFEEIFVWCCIIVSWTYVWNMRLHRLGSSYIKCNRFVP